MKKIIAGFVAGLIVATSGVAFAAQSIKILVNGKEVKSDVPAQVIKSRTMVPLRAVGEALGATVEWDGKTNTVKITAPWLPSNQTPAAPNQVTGSPIQVNITNVEISQGDEFNKPKQDKEYIILHLTLKNTGSTIQNYNPLNFKVKDSSGNITTEAFATINNDTALSYGELSPTGTVSGTICYEVPKGDSNLQLLYEYEYGKHISTKIQM